MIEQKCQGVERETESAQDLLPTVYEELRRLAESLSMKLPPGQTLQPTALVHEAYLRLVKKQDPGWDNRRHFFGAAAQAMRDILIEQVRRKRTRKHGGGLRRIDLTSGLALIEPPTEDFFAVNEAIEHLQAEKPHLGEIVMLRYYAGLSVDEAAAVLEVSPSTLAREWRFARAWLVRRLAEEPNGVRQ